MDPAFQRALAQFDAAAWISSRGARKESLYSRAKEYLLTCPLCGSSRLRYNTEKHTWICWSCGRTGSTLKLIELIERCNEMDAIDFVLGQYVGGDASNAALVPAQGKQRAAVARVLSPIPWPENVDAIDPTHPAHAVATQYLAGRGIGPDAIRFYRLGFGRVGRLKNRIVFPCYMNGQLVYWQARATWDAPAHLHGKEKRAWEEATGYRKTINPIARSEEDTGAAEALFGLDTAVGSQVLVLVEGPVDAIKVGRHAVALLGKSFQPAKLARLSRLRGPSEVIVYLDRDAPKQAQQWAEELAPYLPVRIVVPPEGYDPGALTPAQNAAILATAAVYRPGGALSSSLKP